MRTLLDSLSRALAEHGLDLRTELRFGEPVGELLRELAARQPSMLVLGIGTDGTVAAWLPRLLEGPAQRPVLIVRVPHGDQWVGD